METLILIIMAITPGVWSGEWGVTLDSQCALRGTSVVIKCEYDYPVGHIVSSVNWYKARHVSGRWGLSPLSTLSSSPDHFRYMGNYWSDCSLKINDVQHTDEGRYYFGFKTTFNKWTSKTFARLSVQELTAVVQPRNATEGDKVSLACVSGCPTPVDIVWYRDGQLVRNPVFQARRQDAGRYHCALLGQGTVRSAPVALNVHYAPEKVTLLMSPSGDIARGSSVTFTCSSDANPPVTQSGYSLFKDGHLIISGQSLIISDIQPSHRGLYHCQAWNNVSRRGIDFINSAEVHLDVQYGPVNVSVSIDPPHVVGGSSVNLTCSSDANPAADSYIWYKRTGTPSSMDQVGSGQVLSIPAMEASHIGLYICQASNQLGENNSTGVLLAMNREEHGSQSLLIIAGIGVFLFVTLVFALLFFWRKQRSLAEKKNVLDFRQRDLSSSDSEDQSRSVYVNIHTLSPPPVTDVAPQSQRSSLHERDASSFYEAEVTYSTVTIKPRNPPSSRALQNSRSEENDNAVIYATVAKSS